jgi:hypothetical protein
MPQPRRKSRTNNAPQPTTTNASDYDTDTANYTDTGIATAAIRAPPLRSNEELNTLVLRRWLPDLQSILAIAPFAVLYIFSPESQAWEKCETQGTLFVCQLQSLHFPRYRIIILNRKNPDNWHYDLVTSEAIEVTDEYVIVQKSDDEGGQQIYGVWIFSDGESKTREMIADTIMTCARTAEEHGMAESEDEEPPQQPEITFEYGMDGGSLEKQQHDQFFPQPHQQDHAQAFPPQQFQQQPQPVGQSIDLATLFGKAPQQSATEFAPPSNFMSAPTNDNPAPQFSSNPDTDFFRTSASPAAAAHHQTAPPSQQNALLDLFRNAKKG